MDPSKVFTLFPAGGQSPMPIAPPYPPTPPTSEPDADPQTEHVLSVATNVLCTEAHALSSLATLYETEPNARMAFVEAVQAIAESQRKGGKTLVLGVGKSGKIGDKLVASMNSLGLLTMALNPMDALHGDLGVVKPNDVLLLITFSGNTLELKQVLLHLPALPMVVITKHKSLHELPLAHGRQGTILLPAPIPHSELSTFGISAPTTSTTVAIALGDALALAVGAFVHNKEGAGPSEVFLKNHPGGAIGSGSKTNTIECIAVPLDEIPVVRGSTIDDAPVSETSSESDGSGSDSGLDGSESDWCMPPSENGSKCVVRVSDCVRVAIRSPKGWVRTPDGDIVPPRRLLECRAVAENLHSPRLQLVVRLDEMLHFSADTPLKDVRKELEDIAVKGQRQITEDTVIALVKHGKVVGVAEIGDFM